MNRLRTTCHYQKDIIYRPACCRSQNEDFSVGTSDKWGYKCKFRSWDCGAGASQLVSPGPSHSPLLQSRPRLPYAATELWHRAANHSLGRQPLQRSKPQHQLRPVPLGEPNCFQRLMLATCFIFTTPTPPSVFSSVGVELCQWKSPWPAWSPAV